MILDESGSQSGDDQGTAASDPFAASRAPDPFFAPTPAKAKVDTKQAVADVSPKGTAQYGAGMEKGGGIIESLLQALGAGQSSDPSQPADEITIGGKTYKFSDVTDQKGGMVKDYSAQDPTADITGGESGPVQGSPRDSMDHQLEMLLGGVQNAQDLSPHEYDKLTELAHGGNKLAQQILVKGHFKTQDYPSLGQDMAKVEDPFVQALSNLPNAANAAEAQITAITQPYDFSNAEGQVNNILKNQGYAQLAQPSAATSAYVNKLQAATGANPLTETNPVLQALGVPTLATALQGLGPAAKLSEKASPTSALLSALLSHIQYEDVYGTGLTGATAQNEPGWIQALLQAVNAQSGLAGLGGALPNVSTAASLAGTQPSSTSSSIPGA